VVTTKLEIRIEHYFTYKAILEDLKQFNKGKIGEAIKFSETFELTFISATLKEYNWLEILRNQ